MTYEQLAQQMATNHPAEDLPYIVAALSEQVSELQAELEAAQERERWFARRRQQTPAQELAVIRQITIPALLERIRQEGA